MTFSIFFKAESEVFFFLGDLTIVFVSALVVGLFLVAFTFVFCSVGTELGCGKRY